MLTVACNFTPVQRTYRIGVPADGFWAEIFNSDAECYGGTGQGNFGGVNAEAKSWNNRPFSIEINLPPLACVIFLRKRK